MAQLELTLSPNYQELASSPLCFCLPSLRTSSPFDDSKEGKKQVLYEIAA
jgi:hypothetical protein